MTNIFKKDGGMKFQTSVKNLPEKIRALPVSDYTIINVEIKTSHNPAVSTKRTKGKPNLLQKLLKNPITIEGFKPFSREEIYNR